MEDQLIAVGADGLGLEVRQSVDAAYDKIVIAMFESLKAMAKMDGDEEDKGQLNYHVVIIGEWYPVVLSSFLPEWEKNSRWDVISFCREYALLRFGNCKVGGWFCGQFHEKGEGVV